MRAELLSDGRIRIHQPTALPGEGLTWHLCGTLDLTREEAGQLLARLPVLLVEGRGLAEKKLAADLAAAEARVAELRGRAVT